MADAALLLFVKAPEPGRVKTRLAAEIGDEAACAVYRKMGRDICRRLAKIDNVRLVASFAPEGDERLLRAWLGPTVRLRAQRGADLGERMANAAVDAFTQGARPVLLVGADGPEVDAKTVRAATAALASHDLVFVPTHDGGYILVGLARPVPGLFRDIAYGGANVLADTLRRAGELGLRSALLSAQRDVDTAEDLRHFPELAELAPPTRRGVSRRPIKEDAATGKTDPRIDAYIANAAEFARPILAHLRALVHKACPQAEETMKWSFPHFDHKGTVCSMAAFKAHCAFTFWKASLMTDAAKLHGAGTAMGNFGRITSLADLPADKVLRAYIKEAADLNERGVKAPRPRRAKSGVRKTVKVPPDLAARLAMNKKARAVFEAFPPSHKREYIEWITEAKRPETRERRAAAAIAMMAEGKSRNWKYEKSS